MHTLRPFSRRSPAIVSLVRVLGICCLGLAFLGVVLPIIPGWPFLIVGARLLGPRDPLIRFLLLAMRRSLRWLRSSRYPLVRRLEARLSPQCAWATRVLVGKHSRRTAR